MPDIKALRSYLVSLGFSVNTAQATQFNNAIQTAAQVVNTNTNNIVMNMAKWSVAAVGMFEAVGIAVVAMADKVATADQGYRLLGQRMFMDAQHAKTLKITMDALGLTLQQIAFDQESHRRAAELEKLQQQTLLPMLGGDFTQTMIQLRSAQLELTKFRIEALYFSQLLVKQIFQALGGEKLTQRLREWNAYIVQHMPEWSRIITTYIVPVLKDAWMIFTDLWKVAKDFAQIFTNIVGFLSGDPAIQGTVSFEKFAHALEKVVHWLALIIHYATNFSGTLAGAGLGFMIGGPTGALIGAAAGGALDAIRSNFGGTDQGAASTGSGDIVTSGAAKMANIPSGSEFERIAHATMMAESGGHQLNRSGGILTSKTGALGLMQLEPGTARQLGVNPRIASENLAGGRAYLNQLYGQFGNWHDALAAYNWGPGNVQNALRKHRAFPSSVEGYASGIMNNAGVQIGQINIMQPNASPEQIKKAITDGIKEHQDKTAASNLAELRSIYG